MTTVAADLPDEPPDYSVVVDNEGLAWQLRADRPTGQQWLACLHTVENCGVVRGPFQVGLTWGQLLVDRGPLTIVHKGAE